MLRRERDYILRQINQASIALARLRERLVGGAQPDEIVQAARAAQGELQVVAMWADLLRIEADAHRTAGRIDEADAIDRRADALARNN
jgi:hypothetical protein